MHKSYKSSRKYGVNLFGRDKDPFEFKNYFPGQHGPLGSVKRSFSPFALQLRAKQKMRYYYNMKEKQFSKLFKKASSQIGNTAENLINLLERRLDMFLYRTNMAPTIFAAKQIVNHRHVLVNGKVLDIKSYTLKDGDQVTLTTKGLNIKIVKESLEKKAKEIPAYIKESKENTFEFTKSPIFEEVPYESTMEINSIIEYYA